MHYLIFLLTILMSGVTGRELPQVTSIIIDKPAHTLYGLTAEGDTVVAYDCALGRNYGQKQQRGDCKTPEGDFEIVSIEDSEKWEGDASGSDYGPWFMRLGGNTQWHSIGIHGTNRPETVGTRASLGCIRLHNGQLQMLRKMVSPGCAVKILPDTTTTYVAPVPAAAKVDKTQKVYRHKRAYHPHRRKSYIPAYRYRRHRRR